MIESEDFSAAMEAWEKHKRKRALKALFEKDSISCDIEDYRFFHRKFIWLKTLICLLLNRTGGSYLGENTICVLAYDESMGYESQSWDACWVSTKVFSDWNVCLACDGT